MTSSAISSKACVEQASIITVFVNGYRALQRRRRQRRNLALQSALSDRALKDIGLRRIEISLIASAAPLDRKCSHARD